jgi:tol-pal system protein YbgF
MMKFLVPVAAIAATGCMASKSDIVLLRDEIRTLRSMEARNDSARKLQADSARAATLAALARTQDSLRALAIRFAAFQANVNGEFYEIGKQLITVQELAGMSSKAIMGLRSTLEDKAQAMTSSGGETASPQEPGPGQLYSQSFDLMRRGSQSTARAGFEEFLRKYPDDENASAALMYIAQTFAEEKPARTAEADSVYQLVVSRYPRSKDAATSLYKYGNSLERQRKTAAARQIYNRVMKEYPNSVEAGLASDRLREPR